MSTTQLQSRRSLLAIVILGAIAIALGLQLVATRSDAGPRVAPVAKPAKTSSMVMQTTGRGRLEEHPPGVVDGVRFEGRFVIWGMSSAGGQVFGDDASLFDEDCVEQYGRGPQCAHLVAVRSGSILHGFVTGNGDDLKGESVGRTTAASRYRIFYDAHPNGSRDYEERAGWLRGELVATYSSDEFFSIDAAGGVFDTRVDYSIISSTPFELNGVKVDFATLAPHMTELDHGHNPQPDPQPEPVPYDESWFANKGPGEFASYFPVGGAVLAAD